MQIFDNRNPISIIFILGTIIVFIYGLFVYGYQSFDSKIKQSVKRNFELWKKHEPYSYSYKVDTGCMNSLSSNVLVVDGVALYEQNGKYELELTIDDIFEQALKGATSAANIEIKYHPKYAFPSSIDVDWEHDVIDDECYYSISNFKVIE